MGGLADIAKVLRGVSMVGGGPNSRARQEQYDKEQAIERQTKQEAQQKQTDELKAQRDRYVGILSNKDIDLDADSREKITAAVRRADQILGGDATIIPVINKPTISGLPQEDVDRINTGLDQIVGTLPEELQAVLSADIYGGDVTKRRDDIVNAAKASRNPDLESKDVGDKIIFFKNGDPTKVVHEIVKGVSPSATTQRPLTPEGKLNSDLAAGLITQDQFDAANAPKEETFNSIQNLAAGFAARTETSGNIIGEMWDEMSTLNRVTPSGLPNVIKPETNQKFEQAERDFINAVLRRESGAAIQESEFKSAREQYIPQAGDSEGVLEQKRKNRELVTASLKSEAGGAFDKLKASMPAAEDKTISGTKPKEVGRFKVEVVE